MDASAQWVQTNGPTGVSAYCLAKHDSVILCGTYQGLYYTSDEGNSWQPYPLFQTYTINSIYVEGDTLILMCFSDSSFSISSFDNGISWTQSTWSGTGFENYTRLIGANGKVFALAYSSPPLVSNDYGLSWSAVTVPAGLFAILTYNGNYIFLTESDSTHTNNYFYLSSLDTINFVQVDPTNYASNKVIVDSVIFGTHVSTAGYYNIIKSLDWGLTWTTVSITQSFLNFSLNSYDSIVCFRTPDYSYKFSYDYGLNWDSLPVYSPPPFINYMLSLDLGNSNYLLSDYLDFFHYDMANDSISKLNINIVGSTVNWINSSDSAIYTTGNYLYRSLDDGTTWDSLPRFMAGPAFPQIISGDTLFEANGNVYRSIDGGYNWTSFSMPNGDNVDNIVRKGNRIYVSSYQGSHFSDNFGSSWTHMNNPPQQTVCGYPSRGGNLCVSNDHVFFADESAGTIFRSDQNDHIWTACFCLPLQPNQFTVQASMYSLNTTTVVSSEVGMFYSNDTGQTWATSLCNGLPLDYFGNKIYPHSIVGSGSDWIAACGNAGVLYSYDAGDNWLPLMNIPSPFIATGVTLSHNQLFVSTAGRGVWTTTFALTALSTSDRRSEIVCYPNPTTDFIRLKNVKQSTGESRILIYDLYGRLMMNRILNSEESINVKSFPSGTYIGKVVNLQSENSVFRFVVGRE